MICEKCGQWMDDGTTVCSKCGAVYNSGNAQEAGATAAQTAQQSEVQTAQQGMVQTAQQSVVQTAQQSMAQTGNPAGQPMPTAGNAYGESAGPVFQPGMTKKEFDKHTNIVNVKKQISACGIACYIIAGVNVLLTFVVAFANIPYILLMLGMGLGIHLANSRVCSIILMVCVTINVINAALENKGRVTGWWILLVGIYAIINTFKYQKAWAEYQKTGIVPDISPKKNK